MKLKFKQATVKTQRSAKGDCQLERLAERGIFLPEKEGVSLQVVASKTMNSMSSSPLLLCYDIRDPKRLQKVHREVKKVGMPLQYSVFYIEMNNDEVSRLLKKLTTIIDTSRDDIRVYAISRFDDIAMLGAPFLEDGIQVFSQGRLMFSPST